MQTVVKVLPLASLRPVRLEVRSIPYSDYGTAFAKEWHQIFFCDPEGSVVEVHEAVFGD